MQGQASVMRQEWLLTRARTNGTVYCVKAEVVASKNSSHAHLHTRVWNTHKRDSTHFSDGIVIILLGRPGSHENSSLVVSGLGTNQSFR